MAEQFGFVVRQGTTWDGAEGYEPLPAPGMWCVHLPHQCDAWDIAGEKASWQSFEGVPHEQAVATLERFIAEAQQALEALKAERELNAEDSDG